MNIVLGVSNGKKVLRDARVNKPWEETASKLDEVATLDKKAVIIGDAAIVPFPFVTLEGCDHGWNNLSNCRIS